MRFFRYLALGLLCITAGASAATFTFNNNGLGGADPNDNLRQIVGGEDFITFDPGIDLFALDAGAFGVDTIRFFKGLAADVPASGVNTIVLQDTPTPFAAGIAASLIADRVTEAGPGFFIYFNSGLDLPRLVFSRDLSSPTADLKVLARLTNLTGAGGREQLPDFSAANFAAIPEPSSLMLTSAAGLALFAFAVRRKR